MLMYPRYANPLNSLLFKKIFGNEKNKDILIHFLNDMIVFKERKPIVDVTFLKTIQDPDIASKKTSIVDILCRDESGNTYVVEMQVAQHKGFEKRAQYYAAKAYTSQMDKGDNKYHNLKEVIFLAIADFVMFPDKKNYKSDHVILDKETYDHDLKDFSFTFLELGKFNLAKEELHTMTEKWAYYFKHAEETSEEDIQKIFENDEIILKAYDELDRFHWNDDELRAYDAIIKRDMDNQAVLEQQLDQAEARGEVRGREEGLEKGREEGREARNIEIARAMKAKEMDLETISSITGLSLEILQKELT